MGEYFDPSILPSTTSLKREFGPLRENLMLILVPQDDGIIPPSHTRRVLGLGLMAALGGKNEIPDSKFGVFRM